MKNKKSILILLFAIFTIMIFYSGCNSKKVSSGVEKNADKSLPAENVQDTSKENPELNDKSNSTSNPDKSSSSVTNKTESGEETSKPNSLPSTSQGPVIQKPDDDGQNKKPDYLNMTVFYTDNSDLFHFDKNCTNIKKGAVVKSGKLSEVIKLGHKIPCKVCVPKY